MKLFRITARVIGLTYGRIRRKTYYIISRDEDTAVARMRTHLIQGYGIEKVAYLGEGLDFGDRLFCKVLKSQQK